MLRPAALFSSTWVVLVVVTRRPGEPLQPVAIAALDLMTGRTQEHGAPRLLNMKRPPYPTGPQALIVTIGAEDAAGFHHALSWRMPERIIDLMIEYRCQTNGRNNSMIGGMVAAMISHGLPAQSLLIKDTSPAGMRRRLVAVASLFVRMQSDIDMGRALLRGRNLCAVARIEATGTPVDRELLDCLANDWPDIRDRVVSITDQDFGFYRGGRFDAAAFSAWLMAANIEWPRTANGALDLSDDTFRDMARAHPEVRPIKELRTTLIGFDPCALSVGRDGRNRVPLRPFASRTGRNQPSTKASVLGTAAWVRHLIKPNPSTALALIDWEQQEFGIAAALSGDEAMQHAYMSGDPYLALAIATGVAPISATIETHPQVRQRFKACALGVQYGIGPTRLALQLGLHEAEARDLLRYHRATFPRFWSWLDGVEIQALLHREISSVFGWRLGVGANANPRSLRNFPMQANGAEMLRLACCLVSEAGISICAPNHDALLIEAPLEKLDETIAETQRLMAEASAVVLDGFSLRTSVRVVRHPDRWTDSRGSAAWSAVQAAVDERRPPARQRNRTCSWVHPRTILLSVSKGDGGHGTD